MCGGELKLLALRKKAWELLYVTYLSRKAHQASKF